MDNFGAFNSEIVKYFFTSKRYNKTLTKTYFLCVQILIVIKNVSLERIFDGKCKQCFQKKPEKSIETSFFRLSQTIKKKHNLDRQHNKTSITNEKIDLTNKSKLDGYITNHLNVKQILWIMPKMRK